MRFFPVPYRLRAVAALGALLFPLLPFGCAKSTHETAGAVRMPGVGSVYSLKVTQRVLGDSAEARSNLNVTLRVADMIFEGKEHVAQFSADTMLSLIAYEANGDLSIYLRREQIGSSILDAQWLRLPFRGTDSVSEILRSTPAPSLKEGETATVVRWSARPGGIERVLVQGKEMEARKVEAQLAVYPDSSVTALPLQSRCYTIWYAPELGYAVRESVISLVHSKGEPGESKGGAGGEVRADTLGKSYRELTAYQLK